MFPVEIFQKTLLKIKSILERLGIRFHLTGGLKGAAYGEPRMTQDIDVVIDPERTREVLEAFLRSLAESDFMYEESAVRRAVATGGMFQLLDERETLKLDIYPRELIAGELDRSQQLELFEGTWPRNSFLGVPQDSSPEGEPPRGIANSGEGDATVFAAPVRPETVAVPCRTGRLG